MYALKKMVKDLGGIAECRVDDAKLPIDNRAAYVGTAKITDIDDAETIYLIGTNPRSEAPVLNARIRKAYMNGANIKLIGEPIDLTYSYDHIGNDRKSLDLLLVSVIFLVLLNIRYNSNFQLLSSLYPRPGDSLIKSLNRSFLFKLTNTSASSGIYNPFVKRT